MIPTAADIADMMITNQGWVIAKASAVHKWSDAIAQNQNWAVEKWKAVVEEIEKRKPS